MKKRDYKKLKKKYKTSFEGDLIKIDKGYKPIIKPHKHLLDDEIKDIWEWFDENYDKRH